MSPPEPSDEILRYGYAERIGHWTSAVVYIYSLLTGLSLYSPHLYWIAFALGGGPTIRFWHPIIGVLFLLTVLWMHMVWRRDMRFRPEDREWMGKVKEYAANKDEEMPLQGRNNAGQKIYFWLMYYGAMLLLVSGLVMWFPEYFPPQYGWLRRLAILLHECAALATIGGFIVHVYMSVLLEEGSFHSMVSGKVSRAWAWTHHRLWYREIEGSASAKR